MTVAKQITNGETQGIAPKAVLAFVYPVIAALLTAVANWIVSGGGLDLTEVRIAAGGVVLGAIAALGAYVGKTGTVQQ
jgi:hypothetical protein